MEENNSQLSNITSELAEQTVQDRKFHEKQNKFSEKQLRALGHIVNILKKELDIEKQAALREKRNIVRPSEPETKGGEEVNKPLEVESVFDWKTAVAALVGAAAGLVAGIVSGVASFLAHITKMLTPNKVMAPITKAWKSVVKTVGSFFAKIGKMVNSVLTNLKKPFEMLSKMSKESQIGKVFKSFSKLFDKLVAPIKMAMTPLKAAFESVGTFGKVFKSFFKVFAKLGRVLGKVFAPLIILFDIVMENIKIFGDESKSMGEKIVGALMSIPKAIGNFFLEIPEMIKDGISWLVEKVLGPDNPVSKFLDSFSFTAMWSSFMDGISDFILNIGKYFEDMGKWFTDKFDALMTGLSTAWDATKKFFSDWNDSIQVDINHIKEFFSSVGKWFSEKFDSLSESMSAIWESTKKFASDMFDSLKNGWESVKNFFSGIGEWFNDKFDSALEIVGELWNSTKKFFADLSTSLTKGWESVTNFFSGIGEWFEEKFEAIGETLSAGMETISAGISEFFDDPIGSVMNIIMAPWKLFKSAISWISEALGFGSDGTGEGNIDELEKEEEGILAGVLKLLFAPQILLTKALDFLLGQLGFESLKEYIPDVGAMLSKAADWVSGLLGDAIAWFQDKLSFFGGGDEAPDMDTQSGRKTAAENDGLVNNPLIGSATIDEKALKGMSNEQLAQLAEDWSGYKKIEKSIEKELASRLNGSAAKQPGNVGTAISAPAVPESRNPAPSSVTGSVQDYAQIASEMYTAQENLSQSKSKQGSFAAAPMIVGGSDNSTVNNTTMNTFTSPAPPSSRDYYDYNTAFKGSTR